MDWLGIIGAARAGWKWVKRMFGKKGPPGKFIVKNGGTVNIVEGDQHVHYHFNGPAEFVQPKPEVGRIIPLEVEFEEGIVAGEQSEAKLIGPNGKVKDVRTDSDP